MPVCRGASRCVIRVVLVDDQQLVRTGLRRILAPREGFEIVAECSDGAEVEAAVDQTQPDLVIMDARMKRMGGAEATRRLRQRDGSPPVLILTTFDDDEVLSASLRAGASGFQLKDAPGETSSARPGRGRGRRLARPHRDGPVLAAYRSTAPTRSDGTRVTGLTEREREVLSLIGRGHSNTEYRARPVDLRGHGRRATSAISSRSSTCRDRAAAIGFAFDHGIVEPQT